MYGPDHDSNLNLSFFYFPICFQTPYLHDPDHDSDSNLSLGRRSITAAQREHDNGDDHDDDGQAKGWNYTMIFGL